MIGELEKTGSRWQLRFRRELAYPPQRVWQALTEREELRKWFPDQIVVGEWKVGAKLRLVDGAHTAPLDTTGLFETAECAPLTSAV